MFSLIGLAVLCKIFSDLCFHGSMEEFPQLPEENMTALELIEYNGYPGEAHEIVTDDGYILTMQRVPSGRVNFTEANYSQPRQCWKQAVILQHGLASSATDWLINLPSQSLAYILADNGYDVWLSNSRGNSYSRNHVKYTHRQSKYWNFTWEEMAEKDLPTVINYVRNSTGCDKIVYVGHSQGTLLGFAKFSSDPILASKLNLEWNGYSSMKKNLWLLDYVKPPCEGYGLSKALCENVVFHMCDPEHKTMFNKTRIAVYLARDPEDTSMKNIVHFGQMLYSGFMQKYDYGEFTNEEIYGQAVPPQYYPENMTVPTAVFWSSTDVLTHPNDVIPLLQKLQNLVLNVTLENFTHLDFMWSLKINEKINNKILHLLKDYDD